MSSTIAVQLVPFVATKFRTGFSDFVVRIYCLISPRFLHTLKMNVLEAKGDSGGERYM